MASNGALDLDNTGGIGDTVLSGLNSGGTINVGDDSNILTINTTSGNRFTYTGKVSEEGGAGAASLVKTGFGEQIFTGDINITGSSTQDLLMFTKVILLLKEHIKQSSI